MFLKSIHLENYRNYRRLDVEVGPSINVFFGANAQGKTNIIEAIYLCACARSHRTSKDKELIFRGENQYDISLVISSEKRENNEESVALSFIDENGKKAKRTAYHNQVPFEKISDYLGIFHAVIFAPEDLQIVKEGPSVRRRYLDILLSQIKPSYFYNILTYSRILMQRNKTLKNLRQRSKLHSLTEEEENEIEIWDYSLSEVGGKIIADRIFFSKKIKKIAEEKHAQISNNKEVLKVRYKTISGVIDEEKEKNPYEYEKEIVEIFLKKLLDSHQDDYERGITGIGSHRDDLELFLDGENLRVFASQGQQRSAALSLKLAELVILKEETGEMPVLLLDDVFSELDGKRRQCLLENIEEAQIFVTCTDRFFLENLFSGWKGKKEEKITFFEVFDGMIKKFE